MIKYKWKGRLIAEETSKKFEEVLRTYPTVKQYSGSCLVSGRDLPPLARVLHYNPVKMGLKVSIQDKGDIKGLDQVLKTYKNMKQYIIFSIKSRYLEELVQVLENNPKSLIQVELSVMIQDGRDFKDIQKVILEYCYYEDYISVTFPQHPTLSGKTVAVGHCYDSEVDEIEKEYPHFASSIRSIFTRVYIQALEICPQTGGLFLTYHSITSQ